MNGFEKRFGKYAIKNLTLILIILYGAGYLLELVLPRVFVYLYLNPYYIIHGFQIWRLFTWLLIPPDMSNLFFTLIMLYFYYSLGNTLEQTWGTYRYNVYILSGIFYTIVGAFILYGVSTFIPEMHMLWASSSQGYASAFSTYYINLSIFLAFATTFPDVQIYIFFILPIKVKVLGIIYAVIVCVQFITYLTHGMIAMCVVIFVSLLNFLIFFLTGRKSLKLSPGRSSGYSSGRNASFFSTKKAKESTPRMQSASAFSGRGGVTRHKCAICGKTDESDPDLQFRFCSKCNGNYEYCENHLFTHKHIE